MNLTSCHPDAACTQEGIFYACACRSGFTDQSPDAQLPGRNCTLLTTSQAPTVTLPPATTARPPLPETTAPPATETTMEAVVGAQTSDTLASSSSKLGPSEPPPPRRRRDVSSVC
jgi:hypothetical protein